MPKSSNTTFCPVCKKEGIRVDNLKRHMEVHKAIGTAPAAAPVNTVAMVNAHPEPVSAPADRWSFSAWKEDQVLKGLDLHKARHKSIWGYEDCGDCCETNPHRDILCTYRWSVHQYGGQLVAEALHQRWAERKRAGLP
jgi:hypothetical protein